MSSPLKRKAEGLDLSADLESKILETKKLLPRASIHNLAKVLNITDSKTVAQVLSKHRDSPKKPKKPHRFEMETDIEKFDEDSRSSSGFSFSTLEDAHKHAPSTSGCLSTPGDEDDGFDSLRGKLLDATNNLIQWSETVVESVNAAKELAEGQVIELLKERDTLITENAKLRKKFNFKEFCIVCGKASVLEIQELSFCSPKCGTTAADRMKRASGAKK